MTEPNHVTLDTLAAYFCETLDDEQEERISRHLADCDRCATLARHVDNVNRNLNLDNLLQALSDIRYRDVGPRKERS